MRKDGQTGQTDMINLIVAFRNFADEPKKQIEKRQRTGKLGKEPKTTEGTRENITDIFKPNTVGTKSMYFTEF
jgi:hypothetical protein